jgi:AcrR family transcriptional regulator
MNQLDNMRRAATRSLHRHAKGPGRPRSETADRAILKAALETFIEHGLDAATIEQIADAAGVARTTLYRRWASKEKLIAEAIAFARGTPESQTLQSVRSSGSPEPLIDALAAIFTQPGYTKLAARLIGSVPSHPELMAVYWRDYLLPRRELVRTLLRGVVDEARNVDLVLDLISGAIVHHLLVRPGHRTRAEMRTYLMRLLRELGLNPKTKRRFSETPEGAIDGTV